MDIKSSKINLTEKKEINKINNNKNSDSSVKFTDELQNAKPAKEKTSNIEKNTEEVIVIEQDNKQNSTIEQEKEKAIFHQGINQNIHKTIQPKNDLTEKNIEDIVKVDDSNNEQNTLNTKKITEEIFQDKKTDVTNEQPDILNQEETLIENNVLKPNANQTKNNNTFNKEEVLMIENNLNNITNIIDTKKDDIKVKESNIETINLNKEKDKNKITADINIQNKNLSEISKQPIKNKNQVKKHKTNIFAKENIQINQALNNLNDIVKELNQSDDNKVSPIKKEEISTDNKDMINNDFNIQENKELLPQMNPNMNFSGDGQPFSSFMNNEENTKKETKTVLRSSAQELAEEAAILSTMAENIAIANKNQIVQPQEVVKTVNRQDGVKKVDTKTNIVVETVVKYDTIIMNEADVEVFANLVENKEVDIKNLTTQATEKSVQISKTLADMLAKAMEKNQPVRIDFDNNISVIIKISRDGKITADFLPSSQVAEAYLKENLPLLRQRFNDNNIEYDSLNQRERRESGKENNRRKGRNNE